MTTVAIIGAGDIGGACAQALAARDCVGRIVLIDQNARAAAGKALDILQSGAVGGFHTQLDGTDDLSYAVGCAVCVIADRFEPGSPEWTGEPGLALLKQLAATTLDAPLVFAGVSHSPLIAATAREAHVDRRRLIGSATEALSSAIAAVVAMEANCSPREVSVTVLGTPPSALVVPWTEAAIGGYALTQVLSQPQLVRVDARVAHLWPPGPYALGTAAARVTQSILEGSRRSSSVLTMLAGEFGVHDRVGAVPSLLGSRGIVQTRVPTLSPRERVQLDTALSA